MQLDSAIYEVLEVKNKKGDIVGSGLTVNSKVLKPGKTFTANQWAWGEDSLKNAVENKRCKKISDGKTKEAPAKAKDNKALESLKKEYQKLSEKLVNLRVGKDDDKISKIESEMKDLETKIMDLNK